MTLLLVERVQAEVQETVVGGLYPEQRPQYWLLLPASHHHLILWRTDPSGNTLKYEALLGTMKNADSLSFLMKVSGVQTLPSPGTCTTLMSPPRYFSLGSRHLCLGVSLVQSPM